MTDYVQHGARKQKPKKERTGFVKMLSRLFTRTGSEVYPREACKGERGVQEACLVKMLSRLFTRTGSECNLERRAKAREACLVQMLSRLFTRTGSEVPPSSCFRESSAQHLEGLLGSPFLSQPLLR